MAGKEKKEKRKMAIPEKTAAKRRRSSALEGEGTG
jgi:hypothetical protein